MESLHTDIRISPEKAFLLGELGRNRQCSPQQVLDTMLDEYFALEQHMREGVKAALEEVAQGKTVAAETVFSEFLSNI